MSSSPDLISRRRWSSQPRHNRRPKTICDEPWRVCDTLEVWDTSRNLCNSELESLTFPFGCNSTHANDSNARMRLSLRGRVSFVRIADKSIKWKSCNHFDPSCPPWMKSLLPTTQEACCKRIIFSCSGAHIIPLWWNHLTIQRVPSHARPIQQVQIIQCRFTIPPSENQQKSPAHYIARMSCTRWDNVLHLNLRPKRGVWIETTRRRWLLGWSLKLAAR